MVTSDRQRHASSTRDKLSGAERVELVSWNRSQTLPVRQVSRARILLLAADGQEDIAIAKAVGCARRRCTRVRQRFCAKESRVCGGMRRSGRPTRHETPAGFDLHLHSWTNYARHNIPS
jgi:hypothetical protein